jgi:hypothetical protein
MIRGSLYGYFTRNGAQARSPGRLVDGLSAQLDRLGPAMEPRRGRLGDALDAYDGQQTANTPQWTRRHLISAPQ